MGGKKKQQEIPLCITLCIGLSLGAYFWASNLFFDDKINHKSKTIKQDCIQVGLFLVIRELNHQSRGSLHYLTHEYANNVSHFSYGLHHNEV